MIASPTIDSRASTEHSVVLAAEKLDRIMRVWRGDLEFFRDYYFPDICTADAAPFHHDLMHLAVDKSDPRWKDKEGLVVAVPRGHAKSTILTFLVAIFWAVTARKKFILIVSDTYDQAVSFARAIKEEIEDNERLRADFGDLRAERWGYKWTEDEFEIVHPNADGTKAGHRCKIVAKSTGSKVRGLKTRFSRPDAILVDDLENDEHVKTPEQRQKTQYWFNRALIPTLDPVSGHIIVIGTILHFDSLLSKLLALRNEVTGDHVYLSIKLKALDEHGDPLWPAQYNLSKLARIKAIIGTHAFNSEYMNDPIDDETRRFRPEWVEFWRLSDLTNITVQDQTKWFWRGQPLVIYLGVDPAISEKQINDFFALVVLGITPDKRLVILRTYELRLDFPEQIKLLVQEVQFWQPRRIAIETVAYQKALSSGFRRLCRDRGIKVRVDDRNNTGDKMQRITKTSVVWERHALFIRAAEENEPGRSDQLGRCRVHESQWRFYEQAMRYPSDAHDDLLDASEGAISTCDEAKVFFQDYMEDVVA